MKSKSKHFNPTNQQAHSQSWSQNYSKFDFGFKPIRSILKNPEIDNFNEGEGRDCVCAEIQLRESCATVREFYLKTEKEDSMKQLRDKPTGAHKRTE